MSARRGLGPWLTTGTVIGLVVTLAGWPHLWPYAVVFAAGGLVVGLGDALEHRAPAPDPYDCAGCGGCGGPDCLELTAEEARRVADELGQDLYRAKDALAYVAGMCDLADEHRGKRGEPATVTTTRVREWLRGAQCARQTGLILPPDVLPTGLDEPRSTT